MGICDSAYCFKGAILSVLNKSRALWNRCSLELKSDEVLAQILDRGSLEDWRALYKKAKTDPSLKQRILDIISKVPLPFPYFWLAALASLGETVTWDQVACDR